MPIDGKKPIDLISHMKSLFVLLLSLCSLSIHLSARNTLGEYYLGMGGSYYDTGKYADQQAWLLRLNATAPNDSTSDVNVYLDYGHGKGVGETGTSWNIGADILVHNENLFGANSMLHPYFGVGISYLDEELPLRLREDGFTWNIFTGAKITIQPTISAYFGGQFWGLWSELGENDFTVDTGLSWWIDYQNGVSVDYQYSLEHEVSYLTLKYLYSWQ